MSLRPLTEALRELSEGKHRKFDPALVTTVTLSVATETDPETGLKTEFYAASGFYNKKHFMARRGKTRYGQPTWRYYKPGPWEHAKKLSFPKHVRRVIGEVLKARFNEILAKRKKHP